MRGNILQGLLGSTFLKVKQATALSSVAFCASLLLDAATNKAHAIDIDQDGASDIVAIDIADNDSLSWSYITSTSEFTQSANFTGGASFGENGDNVAVGFYQDDETFSIGYTTESGNNVLWRILTDGQTQERSFGSTDDLAVVAGADVNGDGVTDAARITEEGRVIARTAFLSNDSNVAGSLPKRGARRASAFYFLNTDSAVDRVGFIRSAPRRANRLNGGVIDLRNGDYTAVRPASRVPGVIRQVSNIEKANGTDALMVVTRRSNKKHLVSIFDPANGNRRIFRARVPNSEIITGDFNPEQPGDEIAFKNRANQILVVSPFADDKTRAPKGTTEAVIADMHNVNGEGDLGGSDGGSGGSGGGSGSACSGGTSGFSFGTLWKPSADASDAREGKPVVLFTGGQKSGARGAIKVYSSNNVEICSLGFKASSIPGINGGADHYFSGWIGGCGSSCGQMRSASQAAGGNGQVKVQWKGNSCLGTIDPCGRHGGI